MQERLLMDENARNKKRTPVQKKRIIEVRAFERKQNRSIRSRLSFRNGKAN